MCSDKEKPPVASPSTTRMEEKTGLEFSREEVKKHNVKEDCWLIIENKVYNVTDFVSSHPGGELLILDVAGRDVTDPFLANHSIRVVEKYLPMFHIGSVSDPIDPPEEVKRYRKLFQKFKDENWFQTDYTFYYKMLVWYAFLFCSSVYCIYQDRPYWAAVFMGMFWQQIAFAGHDVGHNSITHDRDTDKKTWCYPYLL